MKIVSAMLVRKLVMEGKSDEIRRLLLSPKQRAIVQWVRDRDEATARELADHMGISIQLASGTLRHLYQIGYLIRGGMTHETGGTEYIYLAR